MKILVTGNTGSGKSTFGKEISKELGIPLYGLDKVVWNENWVPATREERKERIKDITKKEAWVIEGVSKDALNEADHVIFLDLSKYRCIKNAFMRFLKNGLGTRKELPKNCPEYIGFLKSIRIALIFDRVSKPWILEEGSKKGESFKIMKSWQQKALQIQHLKTLSK